MNPLIDSISTDFRDRLLKSDILEIADVERLEDLVAVTNSESIYSWKSALIFGLPLFAARFLEKRWLWLTTFPSLTISIITSVHLFENHRLFRSSAFLSTSFNECLHEVLTRQATSFGLGLSGSGLILCREKLVRILRSLCKDLRTETSKLVGDRLFSEEEKLHLYDNYMMVDTKELLGDDTMEVKAFTNIGSIKSLWELCQLFRSEYFFYLFKEIKLSPLSVLKSSHRIQRSFSTGIVQLTEMTGNLRFSRGIEKTVSRGHFAKITGMEQVKLQLQELFIGIENNEVDDNSLAAAILRIYNLLHTSATTHSDNLSENNTSLQLTRGNTSDNIEISYLDPILQPVDQVFEATAMPAISPQPWIAEFGDDYLDRESGRMVLNELEIALIDRAKDMRARERRALAAFYQVEECDLQEEKKLELPQEDDKNIELFEPNRDLNMRNTYNLPNLATELTNAIRTNVRIREEILETDDN